MCKKGGNFMKKSELYNVKSAEFNELIDSAKVD